MESQLPDGSQKYSPWCHRRPLVCADTDRCNRAFLFSARRDLSSSERAAFYLHELTGCAGFEFVAFSNIRLRDLTRLPNGVVLLPCFYSSIEGHDANDPLVVSTIKMEEKARYIYDGWIPITSWDERNVGIAIQAIDEALSVFCMTARVSFEWKPKYPVASDGRSTYELGERHLRDLAKLSQTLDALEEADRTAIYRSLAWLSQGIRLDEPAARFLFSFLAIESLATYIEETVENSSPLVVLKQKQTEDSERDQCIKDTLAQWLDDDPKKAVERAYFDCVTSITKKLKLHLKNIFTLDTESYDILFKHEVDGKTLYDIRHYIAHGGVNTLSELQREQIRHRIWDVERVACKYIQSVLQKTLHISSITPITKASVFLGVQDSVGSQEGMYRGPTHMAIIYSQ